MKVRICQLLCPQRHCIIAAVYEDDKDTARNVKLKLAAKLTELKVNPWCGICGDIHFAYEDKPTIFESIADALPVLYEEQRAQLRLAAVAAKHPKLN